MSVHATTRRVSDRLLASLGPRLLLWTLVTRNWLVDLFSPASKIAWHWDEHFYFLHEDAARITIARFGELPAWNPYYCGGIPGIGNPQDVSLSPDFLLRLAFGTSAGRRLATLLFVLLGMEGTFRWARKHDASVLGAALAGIAFATSARFVGLVHDGWLHMFAFELMPWAALAFEAGIDRPKWRLLGGFVLAWMVCCGGTYVVPYTGVLLGCLLVAHLVRAAAPGGAGRLGAKRALFSLGSMIGASAAFAAPRVLPMLSVIGEHPRYFYTPEATFPGDAIAGLALAPTDAHLGELLHSSIPGWNYVGTITFLLAAFAVVTFDRRALAFALLAVAFGALSCGEQGPFAPWTLLHKLPIFSQLRTPYRFIVVAGLAVSLAAARGVTRLEDAPGALARLVRRWLGKPAQTHREAFVLGALATALSLFVAGRAAAQTVGAQVLTAGSAYDMAAPVRYDDAFEQARGNRWDAQVYPAASRGTLACFEETEFPQSPELRGDRAREEFVLHGDATVARTRWSPTKISLHVVAGEPFVLAVNQNYHPAWRASVGEPFSSEGLLSVRAPAGDYELTLTYRDYSIYAGVALSLAALAGSAWVLVGMLRRRARALGRLLRR